MLVNSRVPSKGVLSAGSPASPLVLSGIAMSNTVQYIITNIAVYCVITVCTCIYIYTYIKHLKIEIYYIGDRIKAMTLFWRLWRVITSFTISHIII